MAASFPYLIHELASAHHAKNVLQMSQRVDIPYTTLWRWERGMTRQYHYELIARLCDCYGLSEEMVWGRIHQDEALRRRGKRVPVPDLSGRRRGPTGT